ncbi:MAG: CRISPR-associated endonuclease Cas1 [Deltaproteobacteria bacterium]|nr:CRISPR-associated endonuclease Cas1 [Deltaproteobacteria bacterium]
MSVVYVLEQGAQVQVSGGRLFVARGRDELRSVPIEEVEQLALMGNVSLTAPATRALLRRGIDTVFLTRSGSFVGRLTTGFSKNILLRRAQHQRFADPAFALPIAKRIVAGKIANQRRVLARAQRKRASDPLAKALVSLRLAEEKLREELRPRPGSELGAANTEGELDRLRGVEGHASAIYFGVFGELVRAPGIEWSGRKRRPPPDPINVLLSFGYTMLGNLISGQSEQAGFDPYFGVMHTAEYGRPSLSLDLIEELRPLLVDSTAIMVLNRKEIGKVDFEILPVDGESPVEDAWASEESDEAVAAARPLIFRREGVVKWVSALERRLSEVAYYEPRKERMSYRNIIKEQVYRLARAVEGQDEYDAFVGSE